MEVVGGLIVSLTLLVLLAGLGLATMVAAALMVLLGLITEMSFRRVFFVSFAIGLFAPVLLAGAAIAAFEDGSLERDLREELGVIITLPDDPDSDWGQALSELGDIQRELEQGEITDEEAEIRVKQLMKGDTGVRLDLGDAQASQADETAQIEAN